MTSLFKDKMFMKIYQKWHKRAKRHPEHNINPLEQAKNEYYKLTKHAVELISDLEYTPDPSPQKQVKQEQQTGQLPKQESISPEEKHLWKRLLFFDSDKPQNGRVISHFKDWKIPNIEDE